MINEGTAEYPQHGTVTWKTEYPEGTAIYTTLDGEEVYTTNGGKLLVPLKDGRHYIIPFNELELRNDVSFQSPVPEEIKLTKVSKRINDRQNNLLKLYEKNVIQKEIARQLAVSLSTVKRDYKKLELTGS